LGDFKFKAASETGRLFLWQESVTPQSWNLINTQGDGSASHAADYSARFIYSFISFLK